MCHLAGDKTARHTFVADAADIFPGANISTWSSFAPHENFCMLCGGRLLQMKGNFAPHTFCVIVVSSRNLQIQITADVIATYGLGNLVKNAPLGFTVRMDHVPTCANDHSGQSNMMMWNLTLKTPH